MKTMNKKQLKEMYYQLWKLDNCYEIKKDEIYDRIDAVIELLYNINEPSLRVLTEKETYILRKVYGILDNGVCQGYGIVANELGLSSSRISQMIYAANSSLYRSIIYGITSETYESNKMTSMDNIDDLKLRYKKIDTLGLNAKIHNILIKQKIYTVGDLLSFSIKDLELLFSGVQINYIINVVHNLGLKFIEELSLEERKQIISISNHEKLMNSSIGWINMNKIAFLKIFKFANKISLLVELIDNGDLFRITSKCKNVDVMSIVIYAKELGLNVDKMANVDYFSMEDMLELKVKDLPFTSKTMRALENRGISSIRILVSKTIEEVAQIPGIGKISFNEIIALIHSYGLLFSDEREKVFNYSSCIYEQLQVADAGVMLEKYRQLIIEKEQLNSRLIELDKELSDLLIQLDNVGKNNNNIKVRR